MISNTDLKGAAVPGPILAGAWDSPAALEFYLVPLSTESRGDNSGGSTKSLLRRPRGSPVYARRLLQPSTCGVNGWMTVNAVSSAWNPSLPQAPQLTAGCDVAADPPARLRDRRAEDSRAPLARLCRDIGMAGE
jgi:hypothetical protein